MVTPSPVPDGRGLPAIAHCVIEAAHAGRVTKGYLRRRADPGCCQPIAGKVSKNPYLTAEAIMAVLVRERSKITTKGQTTVPKAVRQALGVTYGGEIAYVVDESGHVSLLKAEETDPVIDGFLGFLAQDMARNPANLSVFPAALAERMAALTAGMTVDLDAEIDGAVTL
ncbi:type II toxin-antitoxin system PrlF family antitoxin [Methylobacterium goesingense]|uniref:Bifunctional DNA-binding transcriptional regulator/antitoxin component of YhaV-PrlF toxin-antitoxin module n=1 Tax=Methylobacterium goesingense TaxID=243690 RepID=A0ABV2L9L3_9HYPH|nr:type II toxin-antitoxin system PrlF family antitoxin [Methylobacterium goesingense]